MNKEKFIKNYRGILKPEAAYEICKAEKEIEQKYSGATYNEAYNRQLIREEKNKLRR